MVSTENISHDPISHLDLSDLANVPLASSTASSAANATESLSLAEHPTASTKPELVGDPANLPAAVPVDTLFDPAAAGQAINAVFDKWQSFKKKTDNYRDTLVAMLRDAHGRVPHFKAFIKENTKIARSTAYRLLAITDGRGEEVRKQERDRQARVRDVTDTPKSDYILRPDFGKGTAHLDPADTAAKRGAEYDDVSPEEFEACVERKVAAELARPTIDKSILDMTVRQVLALGSKCDDGYVRFETEVSLADDIDLELYDATEHAAGVLASIHEAMEEPLHEQIEARDKATHQAHMAQRKAAEEAAELARIERIAWEVENPDEARRKYYDQALANAMEKNGAEFDQAAFDASYKPRENGMVDYENPEHEFFTRWYEEHNTIWPGHRDAPVVWKSGMRKQLPAVNLDYGTDIAKARKLLDAAEDRECDKADKHKARCALAAFLKVALPTSPESHKFCDYRIDSADCGHRERQVAHDAWWNDNLAYLAAEHALSNELWAIENPEEAVEEAKQQAERAAAKEKQLIKDAKAAAKNPDKLIDKARLAEQNSEMDCAMDEAKEEARESGERFSDTKDEWVVDWLENNWTEEREAEFLADFKEKWQADHGEPFPGSTHK